MLTHGNLPGGKFLLYCFLPNLTLLKIIDSGFEFLLHSIFHRDLGQSGIGHASDDDCQTEHAADGTHVLDYVNRDGSHLHITAKVSASLLYIVAGKPVFCKLRLLTFSTDTHLLCPSENRYICG